MTRYLIGFIVGLVMAGTVSIAQEWSMPAPMPPPVVIVPAPNGLGLGMLYPGVYPVQPLPAMTVPHWQKVGPC